MQINNYYFKLLHNHSYINITYLSNDQLKDYNTALNKNSIMFQDAQYILSFQNMLGLFKADKDFKNDYEMFKTICS